MNTCPMRSMLLMVMPLAIALSAGEALAATRIVTVAIKNDSRYTVTVTVRGFQGSSVTATLGPRSKTWNASVTTQDSSCQISANGPRNSIDARLGTGRSKRIVDDRRAGYIRWD